MSYWMGRTEIPPARSNGGTGNVGAPMTTRGVAGGFVTVTINSC